MSSGKMILPTYQVSHPFHFQTLKNRAFLCLEWLKHHLTWFLMNGNKAKIRSMKRKQDEISIFMVSKTQNLKPLKQEMMSKSDALLACGMANASVVHAFHACAR